MEEGNGARRARRPAATAPERETSGSAIRQAFLRHIDEQQLLAGFAPSQTRASAVATREKPRGRAKR
jgi:hypothetical protein